MTSFVHDRKAYTPVQAAEKLGDINYRTVLRLIREEKLGAINLGRSYLIPAEEIDRLLAPAIKTPAD